METFSEPGREQLELALVPEAPQYVTHRVEVEFKKDFIPCWLIHLFFGFPCAPVIVAAAVAVAAAAPRNGSKIPKYPKPIPKYSENDPKLIQKQ